MSYCGFNIIFPMTRKAGSPFMFTGHLSFLELPVNNYSLFILCWDVYLFLIYSGNISRGEGGGEPDPSILSAGGWPGTHDLPINKFQTLI